MYIKVENFGEEFLFNGWAYMMTNNSPEKLSELEEEMKTIIGKEYSTFFQLEAMYHYNKHRGLPANTVSVVAQLKIGESCIVYADKVNADATIKRISKSFCCIDWKSRK